MASFLKVVLAGTLATALVPWLLTIGLALEGPWSLGGVLQFLFTMALIGTVALGLAAGGAGLLGVPLAIGLRRLRLEGALSYGASGAIVGYMVAWGAGMVAFGAAAWPAMLGAFGGGVAGRAWWTLRRNHSDVYVRPLETLRLPQPPVVRETWARYRVAQTWPPRTAPPGDIAISPLALVMGLVVLGFTVVVASAGTGRFDWPPPQKYFPADLWAPITVTCQHDDETVLDRRSPLSDFEAAWYSDHLRAAHERSLYMASRRPAASAAQSYRFTWLRTFHAPVVIRVDRLASGEMRLTAKRLSGHGGYDPGRIEALVERNLSPDETARLERTLSTGRVLELAPVDCGGGTDGARWIFEANDHGSYRHVMRWTPKDGPIREIGLLLMSFTGWRFEPVY